MESEETKVVDFEKGWEENVAANFR